MYYSNGRAQEHLERSLYITNAAEPVSATSQHAITDLPWSFPKTPSQMGAAGGGSAAHSGFYLCPRAEQGWGGLSSSLRLRAGSKHGEKEQLLLLSPG